MTAALLSTDVQRFRALVGRHLGLRFEDSRLTQLADVLRSRLADTSLDVDAYLGRLAASGPSRREVRALARELTVGETYFFRNGEQFRAFSEVALPERMRVRADRRRLQILSAGCASGEEAYSLAILLSERLADPSWSVSIGAVDLNAAALARAAQGSYSPWSLRETPADTQRRYFRPRGPELVLDEGVRRLVRFEERNLAEADGDLWLPGTYDVVFCRNVLMYFTPENAAALVGRIATSLAPGGYLFLGHAETLRGLSHDFHLRHTHGTFYYQRRESVATGAASPAGQGATVPAHEASVVPAVDGGDAWVDVIRRASDRIHALAHAARGASESSRGGGDARPRSAPGASRPAWDLGLAMELLKEERFGEALDRVDRLPAEAAADGDVLLLRAALLTHNGRLAEAERTCEALLRVDELSAGAHYLLALCREGVGDLVGATHRDQIAAYLDPSFAMPRLHMGLMARRAGDRSTACQELSRALELLQNEDASRLLLFGGGFSRDALRALCRAEIVACGGRP